MLRLRIKELAAMRGIDKHVGKFLMDNGIGRTTAYKLARNEMVEIKVVYLERLAHIFKCDVNELFVYEPKDVSEVAEYAYLQPLLLNGSENDVSGVLQQLSQKALKELIVDAVKKLNA